jgi:hypothetical protein
MPAFKRVSPGIVGPVAPQRDRSFGVPAVERTLRVPRDEHRASDFVRRVAKVMCAIDSGGGAVLLADRVRMAGIAQCLDIGRANIW